MAMGDISLLGLGAYTRTHDRYGNLLARAKPVEEPAPIPTDLPTAEETPEAPAPTTEAAPHTAFSGVISAMGMDTFMPNGGSGADAINQANQAVAAFMLNPELAAQLISNQTEGPPPQDSVDAAMNALSQNYDVSDPMKLFKQLDVYHAGQVLPWTVHQAVAKGGGTLEQSSALVKQLDPFGNGAITIQQLMANLPAAANVEPVVDPTPVEPTPEEPISGEPTPTEPLPPEPTPTEPTPVFVDNTAAGGLVALSSALNPYQPPQDMFMDLDTDFDGMLSQDDIMNAVMAGGGTPEAGTALYAQLDPDNTGVVTRWQFAANLTKGLPNIFV